MTWARSIFQLSISNLNLMVGKYWSRYNCSASGHAHLSTEASTVWICACRSTNDGLQKAAACSCSRPGGYGELAATPVGIGNIFRKYFFQKIGKNILKNIFDQIMTKNICNTQVLYHFGIVRPNAREIMMGEGNEQPPLCWLPLWVVELGLVAESCQHNSSTP